MRRAILLAAAVALPLAGVLVGAGPAGASTGKTTCTGLTGTATGTVQITGCSGGVSGNSTPVPTTTLATGGTITFSAGTVDFASPTLASAKATKCPGYVKSSKKKPYTGPEPSLFKYSGTVSASTVSGLKVPGKFKGEACSSASGTISAAKALTFD